MISVSIVVFWGSIREDYRSRWVSFVVHIYVCSWRCSHQKKNQKRWYKITWHKAILGRILLSYFFSIFKDSWLQTHIYDYNYCRNPGIDIEEILWSPSVNSSSFSRYINEFRTSNCRLHQFSTALNWRLHCTCKQLQYKHCLSKKLMTCFVLRMHSLLVSQLFATGSAACTFVFTYLRNCE